MEGFVQSRKRGWKANNVFGEGTSPKLRGLRDGLEALGLNSEELLIHGIERCMYGVKLARNVDRYLLGIDERPGWVFDPSKPAANEASRWWIERWGKPRSERKDVRESIEREGLAYPIRHRARVHLPERDDVQELCSKHVKDCSSAQEIRHKREYPWGRTERDPFSRFDFGCEKRWYKA